LLQRLGWVKQMFQGMMTDGHIRNSILYPAKIGTKLNAKRCHLFG